MKVFLHLATSLDGYIAKPDGDSSWVDADDEKLFLQRAREAGSIVVGRKTFNQYKGEIYPVTGVFNMVLTKSRKRVSNDVVSVSSPKEALALAEGKGVKGLLVAGGGETSTSFLNTHLVDEVFLSVHPLLLGSGIRTFGGVEPMTLELLGADDAGAFVRLHYKVYR